MVLYFANVFYVPKLIDKAKNDEIFASFNFKLFIISEFNV